MENSNNGLLGNPDELNWLNMINAGGIRGLLQSLSKTQITGGGNYGAGERVLHGNLSVPLTPNFMVHVGGNSLKAQGINENKLTDAGVTYIPKEGENWRLNVYRRPNEHGPDQGVWATFNKQFP